MLLRLFIIELEKLCSSCSLVEKYAKKRLECLGNVGWYINHGLSDKHLRAARFFCVDNILFFASLFLQQVTDFCK